MRPTRAWWRASAERSITALSRSKRSATTSPGTNSDSMAAARVPGRGEKMNVNAESYPASAHTASVSSKSASVSPGNPTMTSVVTAKSSTAARAAASRSR